MPLLGSLCTGTVSGSTAAEGTKGEPKPSGLRERGGAELPAHLDGPGAALAGDEDVGRFEVAVPDVDGVQVVDSNQELQQYAPHLQLRQLPCGPAQPNHVTHRIRPDRIRRPQLGRGEETHQPIMAMSSSAPFFLWDQPTPPPHGMWSLRADGKTHP